MTRRLVIIETTTELQGGITLAKQTEIQVRCDRCRHWNSGKCERLSDCNEPAFSADNTCCGCSRYDAMTDAGFGCAAFEAKGEA